MLPTKYHTIRVPFEGNRENSLVTFSDVMPVNLGTCTGILVTSDIVTGYYFPATFYLGEITIEFDKKITFNFPVIGGSHFLKSNEFLNVNIPLNNTLVTGFYKDCNYKHCLHIYFRCTQKHIQ